jgi:DNA-binding Lrp family transcriptional regulator
MGIIAGSSRWMWSGSRITAGGSSPAAAWDFLRVREVLPQPFRLEFAPAVCRVEHTPDFLDEKLMAALAQDGRASLPELGQAPGRSPAGVTRRLERLRSAGAVRFPVDIAPELLGHQMLVRFWLRVAPGALGSVGRALAGHPQIPFAAVTTGPSNLVATGHFDDAYQLYQYLDHQLGALTGVLSMESAPILREVKRLTYGTTR